ncbi:hypothetical protein [Deinococcus aquiradiocola]|uniref:hypothetical protein n=1 Tax=Deinococcus aquiradiocola TaxID=393059 RepID=UPI00166BA633|nr:hypothetical protein [Deinococcus aquiradiocola]
MNFVVVAVWAYVGWGVMSGVRQLGREARGNGPMREAGAAQLLGRLFTLMVVHGLLWPAFTLRLPHRRRKGAGRGGRTARRPRARRTTSPGRARRAAKPEVGAGVRRRTPAKRRRPA